MNEPYYWAWKTFVSVNRSGKINWSFRGRLRPTYWESWATDGETFPNCLTRLGPPPGPAIRTD